MTAKRRQSDSWGKTCDALSLLLRAETSLQWVRELRFDPTRRFRFDYAQPDLRIAVEVDGGVWRYGRHNRPEGYIRDMEKMTLAASQGWLVLHFTPEDAFSATAIEAVKRTVTWRKEHPTEIFRDKL